MKKERKKGSIIFQVAVLFLIGVLTTGAMTYIFETRLAQNSVTRQTELHAADIAADVKAAVAEYPAADWLVRRWYEDPDSLDIEYDADFWGGTRTEEKCREFSSRHPELQLRYVTEAQLVELPEKDQKLYAEIAYSWLITRIDQIKRAYNVDFLFCVVSEEPFERQFFLFSAADPGAVRGTNYEEVYPLGHTVSVSESQTEAMREAVRDSSHLADAGSYMDYYANLGGFDGHSVLVGLTYDVSYLKGNIGIQTRTGAQLAILHQLLLSVICLALIFIFVLRPLNKVQQNIRTYEQTKDSAAVIAGLEAIRSHNEIGHLSEVLSDMVREIDVHMDEIRSITAEQERIGTELELATRIQTAVLPSKFPPFPEKHEFDIYASMDPAKEVGGDFYDFFLIDDDHLGLAIADVSGKGIPAALFMMVSKLLVKNYAMTGLSAAATLEAVNKQMCVNNRADMFVTVWLGILEISTGILRAANAGHEYPAVKSPDGGFELLKDKHGFVIGGLDGVKYKEYEIKFEKGSKLFVYTDGVPEATDAENAMFGTERMLAALNADPDASPKEILGNVRGAVDGFVKEAEQFDDLTMLCLEYRGSGVKELTLEATDANLDAVFDFIDAELDKAGCPAGAKMQINVAAEEVFVNIAHYAYEPETGSATVRIETQESPRAAAITFIDSGMPYDPLSREDPDVTLPAEQRQIGGLGVFLVKKLMDGASYEYRDGQNVLRMYKEF